MKIIFTEENNCEKCTEEIKKLENYTEEIFTAISILLMICYVIDLIERREVENENN